MTEQERRFPQAEPELIYDLARNRHSIQMAQIEGLDGKLTNLLTLGTALLGILAAVLGVREDTPVLATTVSLSVAGAVYLGLVCFFVASYFPRPWQIGPSLDEAWDYADKWPAPIMRWWAAEAFMNQSKRNEPSVTDKVRAVQRSMGLVIVQALVLVASVAVAAAA